ncbi:MAG: hypothetical protein E2O39_06135 [Planctomycetota bacterium]|nr:MAG: hypothetical protein E2O39_06135 [Planctomycetota bacterium]
MLLVPVLLAAVSLTQDGALAPATSGSAAAPASASGGAEALRQRIHDMRMNLLLGGDRVRQAESEAVQFYSEKAGIIDRRLDSNSAELSEKRAVYDLALDRSLAAGDSGVRLKAMREAAVLRAGITELEGEARDLAGKRKHIGTAIRNIESRDRERERLVAQLATASDFGSGMGFPLGSIGLAPPVEASAPASPLDDPALVEDLLRRDPRGARRILFEADPEGYWMRFPLQPPAEFLRAALRFPLPDLPNHR